MLTKWDNHPYIVVECGVQTRVKPKLLNDFLNIKQFEPNYLCTFYIFNYDDVMKLSNGEPLEKIYLAKGRDNFVRYTAQCFPIDIDAENLDEALMKLNYVLKVLKDMDVDINLIYLFFSGKKGFHLFIPSQHFGGWKPQIDFKEIFYNIFDNFKLPKGYADRRIYSKRRGMKVSNTQHPATNLYKIQLKLSDLDLGIEHIKKLAVNPRENWEIDTSLIKPNDNLISLTQLPTPKKVETALKGQNKAQNKAIKRTIKVRKLKRGKFIGERNGTLCELLVKLREQGHSDYTYLLEQATEFAMNCTPPMPFSEVKSSVLSMGGYEWDYDDNALRQHLDEGNAYLNEHLRTLKHRHVYMFLILKANRQVNNYYQGFPIAVGEVVTGGEKTAERINRNLVPKDQISPRGLHKIFQKFEYDRAVDLRVVKKGNSPQFTIVSHNFFNIHDFIRIKEK